MSLSRRRFLGRSLASTALAGYALAARAQTGVMGETYRNEVYGFGPLQSDPAGVLDLPEGFSYRVLSRFGDTMTDGMVVPDKFDGMGCFGLDDERVALVRNHELNPRDLARGPFGRDLSTLGLVSADKAYAMYADRDVPMVGGTTTMIYNLRTGQMEEEYLSLVGTLINCGGGITPWGSWLTCEETTLGRANGLTQDHGWVFEVPAAQRGLAEPVPITGMGRFRHEAACIDPRTGIVYQTEDTHAGLFYRYLPEDPRHLHRGGRLQALMLRDTPSADTRNWEETLWQQGESREVVWVDIDGVDNPHEDIAERGHERGAAYFARGEGVIWAGDHLYFACTSGGRDRHGQILRYVPSPHEGQPGETDTPGVLELFVEATDRAVLDYVDNIDISPWGHVIGCEDKEVGVQHIKGVTPEGRVYTIARNALPLDTPEGSNTEFAGVCFSPDGQTMFVNLYAPGQTLAITGPWSQFRS